MASTAESFPRNVSGDPHASNNYRSIPILPSSSAGSSLAPPADPMDVSHHNPHMGPPATSSTYGDRSGGANGSNLHGNGDGDSGGNSSSNGPPIGAAAAAQQPKVVQTAFIHKLYNMLEDQNIQHLISWSSNNESFVMSPSSEFSKVLAQYFKHTNISSFVRQLNMYGFHKVSDVFHTASPDSPLWEFKHGNGNFKRGDLVGLREIKRRASRHALIHRDSFSTGPKTTPTPAPGTTSETMQDPVEARLGYLEQYMVDRMARTEDSYAYLNQKCQTLAEGSIRSYQWNVELSNCVMGMLPDQENHIYSQASAVQREAMKQLDVMRGPEDAQDSLLSVRQPYFHAFGQEAGPPLSPRQMSQATDSRRPSLANTGSTPSSAAFRAPAAPHLAVSPRRYGSISTGTYSPSGRTPPGNQGTLPPPPTIQHPLSNEMSVNSPPANLARRHTSADIRQHGWQAQHSSQSPYASGHNSGQWPSSPSRAPVGSDQQIRDALARYDFPRPGGSRQPTPPSTNDTNNSNLSAESAWSLPVSRYAPFKGFDTAPPTRRSSMASNVHSLLNPADTAECPDEDLHDDRKRKRMQ